MVSKVFYASGSKGKECRVDGSASITDHGKLLKRGWYAVIEGSSYSGAGKGRFGPFKTKTEANIKAWGTAREPRD